MRFAILASGLLIAFAIFESNGIDVYAPTKEFEVMRSDVYFLLFMDIMDFLVGLFKD